MRVDPIFEMALRYTTPFDLVQPFGGEEGWGYGEGEGTLKAVGDAGAAGGTVRWVNHPRRRSDGAMLPDTAGRIQMDDGATVLFRFGGRTVWSEDGAAGGQLLWVEFLADDERYRWLNEALCVLEGAIDSEALVMRARIYACRTELV